MDNLIQTIQEQINLVMNSKCAKYSDKRLETFDKQTIVKPELIKRAIELYSNGFTMKQIGRELKTSVATIQKVMSQQQEVETQQNNFMGMSKRKIHEEKTTDLLNGMGVHEFCEKWNCPYKGYYDKKSKVRKKIEKD
jgi:hypothetical protein